MKAFLGFFTRNLLTEFVFALWHPQNQTTASPAPTERDTLILLLLKCYNDDNLKVQICVCVRARGGGGACFTPPCVCSHAKGFVVAARIAVE